MVTSGCMNIRNCPHKNMAYLNIINWPYDHMKKRKTNGIPFTCFFWMAVYGEILFACQVDLGSVVQCHQSMEITSLPLQNLTRTSKL